MVRKEGLEPTHPFGYQILSLARLPVPPLSRVCATQRTPETGLRERGPRARSIAGRRTTGAGRNRTLVTITSLMGPRDVDRELMALRAGTNRMTRPAARALALEYRFRMSGALELDTTTEAPRWQAAMTDSASRAWSAGPKPSAV